MFLPLRSTGCGGNFQIFKAVEVCRRFVRSIFLFGQLFVCKGNMGIFNRKSLCVRVDALLEALTSAISGICASDGHSPEHQQPPILDQFYKTLQRGAKLLKKCKKIGPFNLIRNCRHALQILKLAKEIDDFVRAMPAHTLLEARKLVADINNVNQPTDMTNILNELISREVSKLTNDPSQNTMLLQQMASDCCFGGPEIVEDSTATYSPGCSSIPGSSEFYVGVEKSVWDVKELLCQSEVSVVGLQCIGGGGKTTVALALCNDPQIKGYFGNRVFFLTVSQSPHLKGILETMWEMIVDRKMPEFQNAEDAHRQLQEWLLRQSRPTLVIFDDVWSRGNLENLLFQGPGYKTLVTTRDSSTIPRDSSTRLHQLSLLGEDDALSLFCFWAFGQTSIPTTVDANLVKEVEAECKGLPLALKVIGSSLHGEAPVAWKSAKNKLSKGEPISHYHKESILRCLETSIDCLDDVVRECFLDLGCFPGDRKICADALFDIWIYVRKLEWQDAFVILLELAKRNLLNLSSNLGSRAEVSYGCASELYFSQHNAMRDLALYLGSQQSLIQRKRLIMPRKEHSLPAKWEMLKDEAFHAQVVSIHTGSMDETQWYEMNLPETEALVLIFTASEYFLQPFVKSMKNLKFLMLYNYGSNMTIVKGLDCLSSITQLKSVRLERLTASPVLSQNKSLHNLDKLTMSLCEGYGNLSSLKDTQLNIKLPLVQNFNIDHCNDLEELPPAICHMPFARMWSITNCHQVEKLPNELGNLSSLRMLRLSALPSLKELPPSIGKLKQLEYLDISLCEFLTELPEEIGQLKQLREIDMRECSQLRNLPRSVCGLTSLRHVICDEKIGNQWLQAKDFSMPQLRIEVVEAQYSLDWFDE